MHRRIDKALAAKLTEDGLGTAPWVPDHGYNIRDYDSGKRARLDPCHASGGLLLLAVLTKPYSPNGDAPGRLTFEVEDHINLNSVGEPRVKVFETIHDALAHLDSAQTKARDDSEEAARAKLAADKMYGDCYLTLDAIHNALRETMKAKEKEKAEREAARVGDPGAGPVDDADDDSDPIDVPSGAEVEDDGEDGAPGVGPGDGYDPFPF